MSQPSEPMNQSYYFYRELPLSPEEREHRRHEIASILRTDPIAREEVLLRNIKPWNQKTTQTYGIARESETVYKQQPITTVIVNDQETVRHQEVDREIQAYTENQTVIQNIHNLFERMEQQFPIVPQSVAPNPPPQQPPPQPAPRPPPQLSDSDEEINEGEDYTDTEEEEQPVPVPVPVPKPKHFVRLKPPPVVSEGMKIIRDMTYRAAVKRLNDFYIKMGVPTRFNHEPPGYENMSYDEIIQWNTNLRNEYVHTLEGKAAIQGAKGYADPNIRVYANTRKVSDYEMVPMHVVRKRIKEMKDFIVEDKNNKEEQEALAMVRRSIQVGAKSRLASNAAALGIKNAAWDESLGKTFEEQQVKNYEKIVNQAVAKKKLTKEKTIPDLVMMPSGAPPLNQPASQHPEIYQLFQHPMVNASANGSCLYYSLFAGLTIMNYPNRPRDAMALKAQLLAWVNTANPNTILPSGFPLVTQISYSEHQTITNYIRHHQNPTAWGDDTMINVFAILYPTILINSWSYTVLPRPSIGNVLTFNADNADVRYFLTLGNTGNAHFVLLTCDPVVNDPSTVNRQGQIGHVRPVAEEPPAKKPSVDKIEVLRKQIATLEQEEVGLKKVAQEAAIASANATAAQPNYHALTQAAYAAMNDLNIHQQTIQKQKDKLQQLINFRML